VGHTRESGDPFQVGRADCEPNSTRVDCEPNPYGHPVSGPVAL